MVLLKGAGCFCLLHPSPVREAQLWPPWELPKCQMVHWLAMLPLLWLQPPMPLLLQLLLGAYPGSAQGLTHTQEPALKWRGECPQRRGRGRLALGCQSRKFE